MTRLAVYSDSLEAEKGSQVTWALVKALYLLSALSKHYMQNVSSESNSGFQLDSLAQFLRSEL